VRPASAQPLFRPTGNGRRGSRTPRSEVVTKHRRLSKRYRDDYRLIVLTLAYTGMRLGELAALRVDRLDFARRRAVIAESVTLVNSEHRHSELGYEAPP
jgi:integrase